jgi:hypothetical protein
VSHQFNLLFLNVLSLVFGKGRKHRKGETVKLVTANGKFYKVDHGAKKVELKDE